MALYLVIVALVISTMFALFKPRSGLFVAIFLAPWSGLDVDIGLRVTGYLLFITPLFFVCCLRGVTTKHTGDSSNIGFFWLIIIYAVILTLSQIPFLPQVSISGGFFRQPSVRSVVQILMFLIMISPIWIVPSVINSSSGLVKAGRVYLASCVILAVIGWWQIVVWYLTGTDPIPIGFFDGLIGGHPSQRSGVFQYLGSNIYRMSSFGGEPRDLGIGLAAALLLLQSCGKLIGRYAIWLWPFIFFSMISTFSTMSILGWAGATIVQLFVTAHLTLQSSVNHRWLNSLVRWLVLVFPIVLVIILSGKSDYYFGMIEMRTIDRVGQNDRGVLEDFNIANLDFLLDQPSWAITGTGLGNSHLYAARYLPRSAIYYALGTPFVAKSSVLRWVSELGLLSLFVFLYWIWSRIYRSIRLAMRTETTIRLAEIAGRFSVPIFALWLVSGYISPQFFMTIGFCMALGDIAKRCVADTKLRPSLTDFKPTMSRENSVATHSIVPGISDDD